MWKCVTNPIKTMSFYQRSNVFISWWFIYHLIKRNKCIIYKCFPTIWWKGKEICCLLLDTVNGNPILWDILVLTVVTWVGRVRTCLVRSHGILWRWKTMVLCHKNYILILRTTVLKYFFNHKYPTPYCSCIKNF